jgi:hypothetical protein
MDWIYYLDGQPLETVSAPMTHHLLGLSYTRSGYGSRLPQPHKVRHEGRLRRVYMVCWSNSGTPFIKVRGEFKALTAWPKEAANV